MQRMRSYSLLLVALTTMLLIIPARAQSDAQATQTLQIENSLIGATPCGFEVERRVSGTIDVTPGINSNGALTLVIDDVNLHGSLTNTSGGKSVELKWIGQDGTAMVSLDGSATRLSIGLVGRVLLSSISGSSDIGYDVGAMDLSLSLAPGGEPFPGPGTDSMDADSWGVICELLA